MKWNFNHIYIEKDIADHPRTAEILSRCSHRGIFYLDRYMEIFGRKRQDVRWQSSHRSLILAKSTGELLYRGSPMCQDYGRREFFYTSLVKNCLYSCEYCYLKGMYDCGYLVVSVNIEDVFAAMEKKLAQMEPGRQLYLSVSFDTDLLSFEGLTGYASLWAKFAAAHPACEVEIRTKGVPDMGRIAAAFSDKARGEGRQRELEKETDRGQVFFQGKPTGASGELIIAYTLSPQKIIERFEHHTAPLHLRLASAKAAIDAGFPVRLCIDPMIYVKDWKEYYGELTKQVAKSLDIGKVRDFGIGTFRISKEYLKRIRRAEPTSEAVAYPFVTEMGFAGYPAELRAEMIGFLRENLIRAGGGEEKIYTTI